MKKLFYFPLLVIGITLILLGIRWMINDEPWMLDKIANEERLGMSFDKLFSKEINETLPSYLKQIYRFFGLWVIIIGLFITGLSRPLIVDDSKIRIILLCCVGILCYSGLILAYIWIPSSHFIYLGYILILFHLTSLYGHLKFDS
ncbi:MAG: hypothetical protein CMC79_01910 [Flavobacteriaceae bacterium]|nr:hypothetical protein [Flavobacteriaceae bacterium]|tara:strand:+ start:3947 stop:4381 length:435 start_codon:yes stop_codon:yes gene_type:complete